MYHRQLYTNIFTCQRPLNNFEKILVGFVVVIILLPSLYYFITAEERAAEEAMVIDNFSMAIDELLKEQWININQSKVFTGDELMGAGRLSQHVWHIRTNVTSDEHLGYDCGFRVTRTLSHPNYVDWTCVSQYHPINKKFDPNKVIEYLNYKTEITDERLLKWPNLSHVELLYFKDREELVDLIKKVQQQTVNLFD